MASRSLALLLALAGACKSEDGQKGRGEACLGSSACRPPLVCLPATHQCGDPPPPALCEATQQPGCLTNSECGPRHICTFHCCVRTCAESKDCDAPQRCDSGLCVDPVCSSIADCMGPGQVCDGGKCVPAPERARAASCRVLPAAAIAPAGGSVRLTALAFDAASEPVVVAPGFFSWSSSDPRVTVDGLGNATVDAGSADGAALLSASIPGGPACSPAQVPLSTFAPPAPGTMRVITTDPLGAPIAGVGLYDEAGAALGTTGPDGAARFAAEDGASVTVTAAHARWSWATAYRTTLRDVRLTLSPRPERRHGFRSAVARSDFLKLQKEGGEFQVALYGASIPGSALDVTFDALLGGQVETRFALSSTVGSDLFLPTGAALGLGGNFWKGAGSPGVWFFAQPGTRAAWGIGGNIGVIDLGPLFRGDFGAGALLALFPVIGRLQSGVVGAAEPGPLADGATVEGLADIRVPLARPLRLAQQIHVPTLPRAGVRFLGAVVLIGGVDAPGRGFVPTGFNSGLDVLETSESSDGLVWGDANDGKVRLRLAPAHGGIEGGDYQTLALAVPLSGFSLDTVQPGQGLRLSGLVHRTAAIPFDPEHPPEVRFAQGGFLGFPEGSHQVLGLVTVAGLDPRTDAVRVDVRDSATGETLWSVWADPSEETIRVPAAPAGTADRYIAPGARYFVQSLALAGDRPALAMDAPGLAGALQGFSTYEIE